MFGINYVKLISVGVVSLVLFLSGWFVNGWRWNARYESLVLQYKEAEVKAQKEARAKELQLQASIDKERTIKDEKIRTIRKQLDATLNELRHRPLRSVSNSSSSCDCKGATGAKLYREDAGFLAGEAARADEIRAGLGECYSSYDAVRDTFNNFNK